MTAVESSLTDALRDRYVIERELGRGGMATVYLAEDLKHRRRVAVKVLRGDLAAALGSARFLREIEVAANLTHPHILPLHDSGDVGGYLYYVMPYIEGESLRTRLQRGGRLPIADTVRILRDVADALVCAHSQGIVHRDIKPDNVMLSGRHALVMDFGVAKAVSDATGPETITTTGLAVGTPAYMAPEQVAADSRIDHRADIYALGVLGYELLTGHPPFVRPTPQQILGAHVTTAPTPVHTHRPEVPPEIAGLVMRCLEKHPADRPQTAQDVLTVLEAASDPARDTPKTRGPSGSRKLGRRRPVLAAIVALTAAAVGATLLFRSMNGQDPKRVVVALFENQTGDRALDPLGRMAAEWLTQGLAETQMLDVVPSSSILTGREDAARAADPVAAAGEATGAGTVVWGSYYRQGDSLHFQAQVSDARGGRLLRAFEPVSGTAERAAEVIRRLRQRVTAGLATMFDPQLAALSWNTIEPPTYEAYREFMLGLEHFYRLDFPASLASLARAEVLDSTATQSTRNHAALWAAVALDNLGKLSEADSVLSLLSARRQRLTELERASLDWQITRLRGDRTGALEAVRRVHEVTPGSDLSELMHGFTATEVNRPREGLAALTGIDERGPQAVIWYWSSLTEARHMVGEHERELADARRGWERLPNTATLYNEVRALAALGRVRELSERIDESLALPPHPTTTPGDVMEVAGLELRAHGHDIAGTAVLERLLGWYRTRPPEEQQTELRQSAVARALYLMGRWADAKAAFERLAAAHPDNPEYLGYVGTSAARLGDRREAERISDSLASMKVPYLRGAHTYWRARITATVGEPDRAVALLRKCFQEGQLYGPELHTVVDFESLRSYEPFRELMRAKG